MTREEQAKYIAEKLMENPEFRKAFLGAITNAVNEAVKVIKSLQQAPCDDAISRQMLKAKMFDLPKPPSNKTYWDGVDDVGDLIDKLPPVTPAEKVGQWIPVSERLPEYEKLVLTWDGVTYSVEQRIPFIYGENGEEIENEWWVGADYIHEEGYYPDLRDGAAIAWMPLPEPWKGE